LEGEKEMHSGSPTEPLRSKRNRPTQSFWTSAAARALAATLLLARVPAVTLAAAQSPKPNEYDVKAAYLLNFGKFLRLSKPAPARSSFEICSLGHDSIDSSLDALADDTKIDGLPVRVNHLQDISAAKSCAIIFISATGSDRIREDLAILGNADILTVSDAPNFLERGGMVQFHLISSHVRFSINLDAVNKTHLVLSSELLRVASSVSGKPPAGGVR
jgi:uncharacterized protein DUF4154